MVLTLLQMGSIDRVRYAELPEDERSVLVLALEGYYQSEH